MARQSRTPMVILGLLCIHPMSGYDLKATIDESVSQFWTESYGQLYPALKELLHEGMVTMEQTADSGRQRKVYSITDAGRARLKEWLAAPPQKRLVRNELLLKVFFGRETDPDVLRRHLVQEREQARGTVRGVEAAIQALQADLDSQDELPFWLITLDLGRRTAIARAEWAEATLEKLEALHKARPS